MKLQNQVCTLEQAKRLQELGVSQDTCSFQWSENLHGGQLDYVGDMSTISLEYLSAFTVAELGVMLPRILDDYSLREWGTTKGKVRCQYRLYAGTISDTDFPSDFIESKYEAQARADLLIHLLESGKITAAEVNASLND